MFGVRYRHRQYCNAIARQRRLSRWSNDRRGREGLHNTRAHEPSKSFRTRRARRGVRRSQIEGRLSRKTVSIHYNRLILCRIDDNGIGEIMLHYLLLAPLRDRRWSHRMNPSAASHFRSYVPYSYSVADRRTSHPTLSRLCCSRRAASAATMRYNTMRKPGLEPGRVSPLDPKSSASTNSATSACCRDDRPVICAARATPAPPGFGSDSRIVGRQRLPGPHNAHRGTNPLARTIYPVMSGIRFLPAPAPRHQSYGSKFPEPG